MDRRIRPWSRISAKSLKVQRQYLRHPNRRNCRHLGTSVVLYRVRRQVGSSEGTQHLFPLPIRRIKCCFTLRDFFLSTFFLYIFPLFCFVFLWQIQYHSRHETYHDQLPVDGFRYRCVHRSNYLERWNEI